MSKEKTLNVRHHNHLKNDSSRKYLNIRRTDKLLYDVFDQYHKSGNVQGQVPEKESELKK